MVVLATVAAACSHTTLPQNTLNPQGPYAEKINALFDPVFWIAAGVFFVVEGLLVFTVFRFRHKPGRGTPPQIHGNNRLELAWTIAPAVLLAAIAVPTIATIFSVNREASGSMVVNVIGHQW